MIQLLQGFILILQNRFNICDVGAGAGFPSIPIKIAFPEINVTIVDSLNKRINFLEHLSNTIKAWKMSILFMTVLKHLASKPEHRESYDVVTARAVARMSVLSELCLPLVKEGGIFIAMKGASGKEELQAGKKAISLLGGEVEKILIHLPCQLKKVNEIFISLKRIKQTPKKYPRNQEHLIKSY